MKRFEEFKIDIDASEETQVRRGRRASGPALPRGAQPRAGFAAQAGLAAAHFSVRTCLGVPNFSKGSFSVASTRRIARNGAFFYIFSRSIFKYTFYTWCEERSRHVVK